MSETVPGDSPELRHSAEIPLPIPLSKAEREAYPHLLYEQQSIYPEDRLHLGAAIDVLQRSGMDIAVDVTHDREGITTVVRSNQPERVERQLQGAFIQGAAAVAREAYLTSRHTGLSPGYARQAATAQTEYAVRQIADNPHLFGGLSGYYAGLRWTTDQEALRRLLFENDADLSQQHLSEIVNGELLTEILYDTDLHTVIGYDERKHWKDTPVEEIFAAYPELDYRNLESTPGTANSVATKVAGAYRKVSAREIERKFSSTKLSLTAEGDVIPRPTIPLTKVPLVEALLAEEVSQARPASKYNFGPSDTLQMILDSDSHYAIRAAISPLLVRYAPEDRKAFDGPSEFEHKRGIMGNVLRKYHTTQPGTTSKEYLRDLVLEVYDAYVDGGAMAQDLRAQYAQDATSNSSYIWERDRRGAKGIVKDILVIGFASSDAEAFAGRFVAEERRLQRQAEDDPLAFTLSEKVDILLSAIREVSGYSQPAVFQELAYEIFGDEDFAERIRHIVELKIKAAIHARTPEVLLALKAWQSLNFPHDLDDEETDYAKARAAYNQVLAPAEALRGAALEEENSLLQERLDSIARLGPIGGPSTLRTRVCEHFIDHIVIHDSKGATELSAAYYELIAFAEHPNVPDHMRSKVLWKVYESFSYCRDMTLEQLPGVILDGYRVALGDDPQALKRPSYDAGHALAAIESLVSKQPKLFEHATEDQLLTLAHYRHAVQELVETVLRPKITDRHHSPAASELDYRNDPEMIMQSVLRSMAAIEATYVDYLHVESVKTNPHVYYPWIMDKLLPLWHGLERAVGPGNSPRPDLRRLHATISDHITNRLVIQDDPYPSTFDVFIQGNLDSLLIECYEQMIVPHNIKYENTVWREGAPFMHYALAFMPLSLVERFARDYGDRKPEFVAYLKQQNSAWNKRAGQD